MGLFRILVWDRHEKLTFEDGDFYSEPMPKDEDWHRFTYAIETDRIRIDAFREFILFDGDNNPQRCVRIFFSDETSVFGRYTYETFEKLYREEYLPLIPPTLTEIVEGLKGGEPTA